MSSRAPRLALLALLMAAACGTTSSTTAPDAPSSLLGGPRPVQLQIPANLDPTKRYPLILVLHGYGANGFVQSAYFGVSDRVHRGEVFALAPDGLTDSLGKQYWNADAACCDFDHKMPDDSSYLAGLIDEAVAHFPIDPKQVFVIGHSNGAYMAYRLALDHADKMAGFVALAGAAASGTPPPAPSRHVALLHVHGTFDTEVPFAGGGTSPGAIASVARWAGYNGCTTTTVTAHGTADLDLAVLGPEATLGQTDGCPADGAADLWTLTGSMHVPDPSNDFAPRIADWMTAHARP